MLLGSVEESGDQHAHLTIWTFSHSCCFAIVVRVNNPWPNAMYFQFPNDLHYHVLLWKSIQSSAIDYFRSHLLAQHSTNEGESATDMNDIQFKTLSHRIDTL